jgi:hypothetical protein
LLAALLATLVVAAGCTTWSKTGMHAQADAAEDLPSMIRVHLKDGRRLTLEHASVVGDSLVGQRRGASGTSRVAVALADIQAVDKNRFNVALTLLNLAIIVGVALGLLALGTQDATF